MTENLEESNSETSEEPTLLRITMAAKRLGVSDGTLRNWVSSGRIRCIKLPSGERRFSVVEIERMRKLLMDTQASCPMCGSSDVDVEFIKEDGSPLAMKCLVCRKYLNITRKDANLNDGDIIPSENRVIPSRRLVIDIKERIEKPISKKYHSIFINGKKYGSFECLEKESSNTSEITIALFCENGSIEFDDGGLYYSDIEEENGQTNSGKVEDVHIYRGHKMIFDLDTKRHEIDQI